MNWAQQRRLVIIAVVLGALLILLGGFAYVFFYTPPSCTDGKRNQTEQDIDCGGECTRLCAASVAAPSVRFVRTFSPLPGRTDVVAYVDNPNINAQAQEAPYIVELYDEKNILVATKKGLADLPALSTTPIFISNFFSGSRENTHAFITFSSTDTKWVVAAPFQKILDARNIVFLEGATPRVQAEIHNSSPYIEKNSSFVATLFGVDGKAVAASATLIDTIPAQGSSAVVFTWPAVIGERVARVEILPVAKLQETSK